MNLDLVTPPLSGQPLLPDSLVAAQGESRPPQTILLAEDNADLRFVLQCCLKSMGYRIVGCADAQIASDAFCVHPEIDVLLTDFEMPGRSGIELAREVTSYRPSLPVMIYTGSTLSPELLQEIADRRWTYISKPSSMSVLEATLQRVLTIRLPMAA